MSLNQDQVKLLKNKIQKKLEQNPALVKEFGITSIHELSTLPAQKLEERLNPRILGILGLSKKDLGMI